MHFVSWQPDVNVPQRIRRTLQAFDHADPGAQDEIAPRSDLPAENAAGGGIVERVLGEACGDGILRTAQLRETEIEGVGEGRGPAQRGLPSLEIQVLDVQGLPDIGGGSSVIIDAVAFAPLEQRQSPRSRALGTQSTPVS